MYTSDIENRRHRSLLEHRRIGVGKVADVDIAKNGIRTWRGLRRQQDDSS